jgi:FixJ family two-component response regulator
MRCTPCGTRDGHLLERLNGKWENAEYHAGHVGTRVQRELMLRRQQIPIVFITAHGDEAMRPRLLEQGAVECLIKPFSDTALREALNAALRLT